MQSKPDGIILLHFGEYNDRAKVRRLHPLNLSRVKAAVAKAKEDGGVGVWWGAAASGSSGPTKFDRPLSDVEVVFAVSISPDETLVIRSRDRVQMGRISLMAEKTMYFINVLHHIRATERDNETDKTRMEVIEELQGWPDGVKCAIDYATGVNGDRRLSAREKVAAHGAVSIVQGYVEEKIAAIEKTMRKPMARVA